MALICQDIGLLYIMAPHTACTAVGVALRAELGAAFLPEEDIRDAHGDVIIPRKHTRLGQLLEAGLLSPQERSRLVVAAGVRDPFDMLVSAFLGAGVYFSDVRAGKRPPPGFGGRRRTVVADPPAFERWLEDRFAVHGLTRLGGRRWRAPDDFTEGADAILRFERLQSDLDALLARLGVGQPVAIPRVNTTRGRERPPYPAFYTARSRAIVEEVFAEQLARFDYRFPDSPAADSSSPA